jgi:hypothetical protein
MGWGWGRGYYGGYGGHRQPGKKAQAASLSTTSLQRIIAQKAAEEEAQARYFVQAAQRRAEAEKAAAEEARLIELHGGRENYLKWREENRERLQAERMAKLEAERKAAGEKAIITELAELRAELAPLPQVNSTGPTHFQINKAQTKLNFHLTDKELEALPKTVIQKEGAKRPSKILWESADVFAAVVRKEGKKKLRHYQAAYNPALARRFIEDELFDLEAKHPAFVERGRLQAVTALRDADDAAIANAKEAELKVEAAIAAYHKACDKRKEARQALREVATADEMAQMKLVELPGEGGGGEDDDDELLFPGGAQEAAAADADDAEEEEQEEEEEAPAAVSSRKQGKRPMAAQSTTPFTLAAGSSDGPPAKKKARASHGGSSSSSSSAAPPPSAAASRPSRKAAAAANERMDSLIKAGGSGAGTDVD